MTRTIHRAAAAAVLTLTAVGVSVATAGPASAHEGKVTLTTSCADITGDGWAAHGAIRNDTGFGAAEVTTSRPTSPTITTIADGASAAFTIQSPALDATATVSVTLAWPDGVKHTSTATVARPADCTPPPATGDVTFDCARVVVTSTVPGASATLHLGEQDRTRALVNGRAVFRLGPHTGALDALVTVTAPGRSPKVIRFVIPKCAPVVPPPTTAPPTTAPPTVPPTTTPAPEPTTPAPTTTFRPAPVIPVPTATEPPAPAPSPSLTPVGQRRELAETGPGEALPYAIGGAVMVIVGLVMLGALWRRTP